MQCCPSAAASPSGTRERTRRSCSRGRYRCRWRRTAQRTARFGNRTPSRHWPLWTLRGGVQRMGRQVRGGREGLAMQCSPGRQVALQGADLGATGLEVAVVLGAAGPRCATDGGHQAVEQCAQIRDRAEPSTARRTTGFLPLTNSFSVDRSCCVGLRRPGLPGGEHPGGPGPPPLHVEGRDAGRRTGGERSEVGKEGVDGHGPRLPRVEFIGHCGIKPSRLLCFDV